MKKLILCSICALFIFTSLFTVSAAKEVGGWVVPGGFPLDAGGISPVTATVDANGVVSVSSGGWYTDGKDWGGIASAKKYTLSGLKVELNFTSVSDLGDRWICIGFLEKPDIFQVTGTSSNRGYANLIRPKTPEDNSALDWQHIEALTEFKPGNQPIASTQFVNGMKLTMEVKKEGSNYKFYLNGEESLPVFSDFGDVFIDDAAHIVIAASGQNAIDNDYQYTVKVTGKLAGEAPAVAEPTAPDAKPGETTVPTDAKPDDDVTADDPDDADDVTDDDVTDDDADDVADDADADDDADDADDVDDVDDDADDVADDADADDDADDVAATSSGGLGGGAIAAIIAAVVVVIGAVVAFVMSKKKK